jgi:hypothetical protein
MAYIKRFKRLTGPPISMQTKVLRSPSVPKIPPVINNSHFGALKVKDAIVDQMREKFGIRPNIDTNTHISGLMFI